MKVLVTGASGFVGYAVARALLERGHRVVGLTRSPNAQLPEGVTRVRGELNEPDLRRALDDVDGVCHLAARTRVRESWHDPVGFWKVNVGGTISLLAAMNCAGVERIVLASTCSIYEGLTEAPISELSPVSPSTPYARSKLAADQLAHDAARCGNLAVTILRAFNIAGAVAGRPDSDTSRLIPKLLAVRRGAASEFVVNGDGSAVRDFVHVADMADAFVLSLESSAPGVVRTFNIGSGSGSTIADVLTAVEHTTEGRVPARHAVAANEPKVLIADSDLIRTELGWRSSRSTLQRIVADAWLALHE